MDRWSDRVPGRLLGRVVLPAVAIAALGQPATASAIDCVEEMLIAGDDAHDDFGVVVDIAPDGRAWVAWTAYDYEQLDEEVFYSIYDGDGWSPRERVHPDNEWHDRFPEISIGSDGVPWVVWLAPAEGDYGVWVSHWEGDGWSQPEVIRTDAARWDHLDLLVFDSDDVWFATDPHFGATGTRDILVYRWDGTEWSEPWNLGDSEREETSPRFGVDPEGRPWLVWDSTLYLRSQRDMMCSAWGDTGWGTPEPVNQDEGNIGMPRIGFDGGDPVVIWIGNGIDATGTDLEYSVRRDGSWTDASLVNLPDGPDDYDNTPSCDMSASGDLWVAWYAGYTFDIWSPDIYIARWQGDGWTGEQLVSAPGGQKQDRYPDVAVSDEGELCIVWGCYEQITAPWDEDIRGAFCSETTPVLFGPASVELAGAPEGALVSWQACGAAASGPFWVWRKVTGGPAQEWTATPAPGAVRLNEEPVVGSSYTWADTVLVSGATHVYWVEWASEGGSLYAGPVSLHVPGASWDVPARLLSVRPNPSYSGTTLGYEQSEYGAVGLDIFTVSGRLVASLEASSRGPGRYDGSAGLHWDGLDSRGRRVATGVYVVQLTFDGRVVAGERTAVTLLR